MTTGFVVNHLWQSSCFAALAGLLAFVLRENAAKVRSWIWLSASLKFLVPFALLASLGNLIQRPVQHVVSTPAPVFSNSILQIAEPFSSPSSSAVRAHNAVHWAPILLGIVWAAGFAVITSLRCRDWFRIRAALRAGTRVELPLAVPALVSPGAREPGIVGFLRPVLILPVRLLERLTSPQLDAVLAHELWHVRRRDNFFAAIHMAVEAIFWFHPMVWWIGSHMLEERELACDEGVLRMGLEPTDYAEAILQVCRLCTESQLPCVSGVTGANVKKRLRAILTGNIAPELTFGKKMLLTAIGLLTLVAPVSIGVLHTPQVQAQSPRAAAPPESARPLAAQIAAPQRGRQAAQPVAAPPQFEVASVKAISDPHGWINPRMIDPQRFVGTDILPRLMEWAYGVRDFQILQAPQWARQQLFEIHATAERPSNESQIRQMLQALLADRFKLRLHRQTKEIPIYALMAGRNGPRLTAAKDASINQGVGDIEVGPEQLYARGTTMGMFVRILTENEDRPVIDKTNLTGHYDFNLSWEQTSYGPGFTPIGAAIFGPIQDLGLKLAPQKDKVQMLVLDSVERPSEN